MTTEAEWREGALRAINARSSIGPYAAAGVLDALITAGYVTPPQPDAVPEGHVRWCIPVQRVEDGSIFIDGEQRVRGLFTRYPDYPVAATIVADLPIPKEPPTVRGRVE